ncbi:MAG: M3 family oligoendopeptidase [Deltaproteobacteria bacterium]|nr:M3 family oligoendopeptidase [Deltaproteobacteria bacterium]
MSKAATADTAKWDLAPLYNGPGDPALEADLAAAAKRARSFRRDFRGRIASDRLTSDLLRAALAAFEELQRFAIKPSLYAQLLFAADSTPVRHRGLLAKVREAWSAIGEELLFFELELLKVDEELLAELLKDPGVAAYAHYLSRLRTHRRYTLSEEVEKVLKRKDLTGREAFVQLFEELTASFRFQFRMPGAEEPSEVTGEELLGLLHHPDRQLREEALTLFLNRHAEQGLTLSACFNNLFLDHSKEVELRRYPDIMTPTHLANETEPAMVERLMEVTEANYGLARDYFRLKKKLLGLEEMKNTDIYAPLQQTARQFPFAEAQALVLDAFRGFSPQLADCAAAFFTERRIDVLPAPGKSGGAFCAGMSPGLSPYVLLNYTGNLRDVATLAHELGHGVHFSLSRNQNLFHYQAPLPFAETASVFGEMLVTRHLLERERDPQVKIEILAAKLEDIIATTFRQNVLTRFELAAHQLRRERLLDAEDFCRLWWEENARLFGDAVTMIEPYRWGWAYISHFIHSRFYCYSYIFGELLVLSLYRRYQEQGASFVPKYLELLAKGGSEPPARLLKPFGIHLTRPDFWQKGYDFVADLLAELKGLVGE